MFSVCDRALEPQALERLLADGGAGAQVTFEGRVRNCNGGREVCRLEYEAHAALAAVEGNRIIEAACRQYPILHAVAAHRTGVLEVGECAVWVGVSAAHRAAAFSACRFIIDELKSRLPIWKKEHYADGDSDWVGC